MKRFINNLFGTKTTRKNTSRRARLGLEALESRQMLSANAIFNQVARQIEITGNDAHDRVVVGYINDNTGVRITMTEMDALGNNFGTYALVQDFTLSGVDRLVFHGNGGNDRFYNNTAVTTLAFGEGGNDLLASGFGTDYLNGGAGSDKYVYGQGNRGRDIIDEAANADYDSIDFSGCDAGVIVDLARTTEQTVNGRLQLTLLNGTGIENVVGSEFGDGLSGNSRSNILQGKGGRDALVGHQGDDYLEGGAKSDNYFFFGSGLGSDTVMESANTEADDGADMLFFGQFDHGVIVNLASSSLQTVSEGNLQLTLLGAPWIENVTGSRFDDVILGNQMFNRLSGLGGNDKIKGYGGDDLLYGGTGRDTIMGGQGNDTLDGGLDGETDYLNGGAGHDKFYGDFYLMQGYWQGFQYYPPRWVNTDQPADFTSWFSGAAYEQYDELVFRAR